MYRKATLVLAALACTVALAASTVASAAGIYPPTVGTYRSSLGQVLPGRATESMPCDLCEGQLGNLITSESWDGSALGTNWTLTCPQIASAPQLTFDNVVSGTGQRIYQTSYSGGNLWLSGTGAWGTGDPAYTAPISYFTAVTTQQYVGGVLVGEVSNLNFFGMMDNYDNCFSLAISNGALVGATGGSAPLTPPADPSTYPPLKGPSDCNATATHGTYWAVHDITFTILGRCAVATRPATWGQVKAIYR